ncbi:MAG: protein kinase [Oscillatoria princeps RMCB-10]|jgi:WD40 repeat protein/serine/threonine protein kinase|nr:protein kinase [Oscillatoria princeps RMCB-10]
MPEESTQWNVGDVILNLYQVTGSLGEGSFGKVCKVRHLGWNIDLAVKIPKPEAVAAAGGVENFEREAETWVNLGLHPHTVSCYYVRRIEGNPVVFAEYVAGGTLHDWIYDGRLYAGGERASLKRILDIAIQFAWGLHYAHEQGLIHQDVKPGNVMVTPKCAVKVTDFGLARGKIVAPAGEFPPIAPYPGGEKEGNSPVFAAGFEALGSVMGTYMGMTPAYCSPEQDRGEKLTRRTDMWGWALSVLEMFVGERTWQKGTIARHVLEAYLRGEREDAGVPQMPNSVAAILRRCFRKNQQKRYRNMLAVAKELQGSYEQVMGEVYPRLEPSADEDMADSLNNRAVSLVDLGKQEEALQLWEKALQLETQHPESIYNRGLILWRTLRINDNTLVRELEWVRNSHPGHWLPNYLLGLVHLERDYCQAAIQTLESIPGEGAVKAKHKGDDVSVAVKSDSANTSPVQAALKLARERLPNSKCLLDTFGKHTDYVNSVCLSPDGRFALSGSEDNTLKLWEVATWPPCFRTFEGHTYFVNSVCLSPDGRFALSGSKEKTLKLWEVATGRCLRTFEGHTGGVSSVCLSPDGRFALSGSGVTLKLWEVATGRCLRTFESTGGVSSVCLSPDGRFALSGSGDKTLKLWEVATGQCLRTFEGHANSVNSVCLSPDGRFALSGSWDETLKLWDVATGRCLRTFEGHTHSVSSVCLSPDGRFALSGSSDKTLKLWEVVTGRCLRTFEGHANKVSSVCLSLDGRFALSGSWDDTVKLWAVGSTNAYQAPLILSQMVATETILEISQTYKREMALARAAVGRGDWAAAAGHIQTARAQPGYSRREQAVKAWASLYIRLPRKAFLGGWESATFAGHTRYVYSVCLSPDGRFALSGSEDNTLKLWEVATGRCLRTFEGHTESVYSVCLSPDGFFALSGSGDKTLKLWDVATGRPLRTFAGHTSYVFSVCLSPDGRFALSGSGDDTLKLWEVAAGRCLRTFEGHTDWVLSVCLSPDGRFALSGSRDNTLKLWEVATGRCLRTFEGHTDSVSSVCLSPDGRFALSGSGDETLKLWDVATGQCLRTFQRHAESVSSVCLSPDGRFALSWSGDKTLKLWEVATGWPLRIFEGHTGRVSSVYLSPDGRFALSGSWDKTLKLWVLDWELEHRQPADWDEGARPYLEAFLRLRTPEFMAECGGDAVPVMQSIVSPSWTEEEFQGLLHTLGCAGYGWLRPEGVRRQLEAMARGEGGVFGS